MASQPVHLAMVMPVMLREGSVVQPGWVHLGRWVVLVMGLLLLGCGWACSGRGGPVGRGRRRRWGRWCHSSHPP